MPNVQDTKSHTRQRAGEPDAEKVENLARLKKPLSVATHLKFHQSAASLGSCRLSPQQQTPPRVLMMPHRGELWYLPDLHRARSCTDPEKSFRDSNVKSKLNFESQHAEEVPRGLGGVPEPFLPNPPCLAHVEEQQRDFSATRTP